MDLLDNDRFLLSIITIPANIHDSKFYLLRKDRNMHDDTAAFRCDTDTC